MDSPLPHKLHIADQERRKSLHVHVAEEILSLLHLRANGSTIFIVSRGFCPLKIDDVLQDLAVRIGKKGTVPHIFYIFGLVSEMVARL